FSGDVSQGTSRALPFTPAANFGESPTGVRGFALIPVAGYFTSLPKKAANSQNCRLVQGACGWSWHWAHSSLIPRKRRALVEAQFSGLLSMACSNASGEAPS